jgi:hypothetical protein
MGLIVKMYRPRVVALVIVLLGSVVGGGCMQLLGSSARLGPKLLPNVLARLNLSLKLRDARADIRHNPGKLEPAVAFAGAVKLFIVAPLDEPLGDDTVDGLLAEANAAFDAVATADPSAKPRTLMEQGRLLLTANQPAQGIVLLERSWALTPTPETAAHLVQAYTAFTAPALAKAPGQPPVASSMLRTAADVTPFCRNARKLVKDEEQRYLLLGKCAFAAKAGQAEVSSADATSALAWASAEDRAFLVKENQRRYALIDAAERQRLVDEQNARVQEHQRRKQVGRCQDMCDAKQSTCNSRCAGDVRCGGSCYSLGQACYNGCAAPAENACGSSCNKSYSSCESQCFGDVSCTGSCVQARRSCESSCAR